MMKEPNFNGAYLGNNLSKIKKGSYAINLDECKSIGTHWIPLYLNGDTTAYFDSCGIEHISKEI